MPLLSLAHFTVVEADPITLIEAARAGGYDAIGLRIVPPFPTDHVFPVIGDRNVIRSIKRRLLETGVRVNMEMKVVASSGPKLLGLWLVQRGARRRELLPLSAFPPKADK